MKKTSTIEKEKSIYSIDRLIDNIACIRSVTGKTGLLNIKTNEIIGKMHYYHTIYSTNRKFYIQTLGGMLKIPHENNQPSKAMVRIYDVLNEKMIVDGFEVVKPYISDYALTVLRSPIDGKIHLFDGIDAYRKSTSVFDMALDDAQLLYNSDNDMYFLVTMNGKKGLCHHNCCKKVSSLVTQIEFDNIERFTNIVVYTKDNEKYFVIDGTDGKTSEKFESITVDENNKNILYCKKGNKTFIYDTQLKKLLLTQTLTKENDEIKYLSQYGDYHYRYTNIVEFLFLVKRKGKFGLVSSKFDHDNGKVIATKLLTPDYDEIVSRDSRHYLKKKGKIGLFIGNSIHHQFIKPIYDDIDYLWHTDYHASRAGDYFALYTGDYCDLVRLNSLTPCTPVVTRCQIQEYVRDGIIYKKDGLYGLVVTDGHNKDAIIPNEYNNISCVLEHYFILDKDSKKGVMHLGETIIPMQYDDIQIAGRYYNYIDKRNTKFLYFSLKKGNRYELAKMYNNPYSVNPVEFVSNRTFDAIDFFKDIMVFRDQEHTYIYDYKEQLLKRLPAAVSVIPFARPGRSDYFYSIDGIYYYYEEGQFEQALVEENDCFVTTYETDTELFEIRAYDKSELDTFCQEIDSQEESEALKTLRGKPSVNYGCPSLVLKRVKKK